MIGRPHICILTSGKIFDMAYGGEEKFAISLGNWLTSRDYDVTLMGSGFATIKSKRLLKPIVGNNPKKNISENKKTAHKKTLELYPPYSIYAISRLIMSIQWILRLILIHMKSKITVIHAQDTGYSGLAAVVSGKLLRIPVIISSHGVRHKSLETTLREKLKKVLINLEYNLDVFTIKNADKVIAVSPLVKDYYEQRTQKKIIAIPIPIRVEDFLFSDLDRGAVRKELGIDNETKVIGFVGRFELEKNLVNLLISFADLLQEEPLIRMVLVGTGSLENELKEYANTKGIQDKIVFYGVRDDIGRILSGFDIFVLPSLIEGLSTALLEAMMSGLAIVCNNIPANRELVVNNKEALLVDALNPSELKHALQLLVNDDSLRLKLGSNAKLKASQYDEDICFPKILECYKGLFNLRK